MRTLVCILSIAFLASCKSLTPFSQGLYSELDLSEDELKEVQFYLSKDIVLYRTLSESESEITKGKIKMRKGQRVQEIVFKRGTPGVVMFVPRENRFAVSFDAESNEFLMFGPNDKYSKQFTLLGKSWAGRIGEVTYGEKVYSTNSRNALAALMVNVNKFKSTTVNRKTAKGRKVE